MARRETRSARLEPLVPQPGAQRESSRWPRFPRDLECLLGTTRFRTTTPNRRCGSVAPVDRHLIGLAPRHRRLAIIATGLWANVPRWGALGRGAHQWDWDLRLLCPPPVDFRIPVEPHWPVGERGLGLDELRSEKGPRVSMSQAVPVFTRPAPPPHSVLHIPSQESKAGLDDLLDAEESRKKITRLLLLAGL